MTVRTSPSRSDDSARLAPLLRAAIVKRRSFIERRPSDAFRVFSGAPDGMDGVFIDVYGPGATLIVYEGRHPRAFDAASQGADILAELAPLGVKAIYHKPFAKDRSRMGGEMPECVTSPTPLAGETLPESLIMSEHQWKYEVRLFDGLSTGIFLDQRENREYVRRWVVERSKALASSGRPVSVLNTFAYTCVFSVAAAVGGAITTSCDVSAKYLDWGKRNFSHNGLDPAAHRFAKMDTFEFLGYASRKGFKYDLIILDPPSFSSGSKKKGIRPWSSTADYAKLVREAAALMHPRGLLFASTNTQELCLPGRLEREVVKGLGRQVRPLRLPPAPADFAAERGRFAAIAVSM